MLLEDLVGVIELLKERIDTHGHVLRENEIRTRVALIDPLLAAIVWNAADPASVRPEYNAGSGRADYGLLGSNGQLVASIEAKRLGESLENHEKQIFDYAWSLKVRYAGLTDGNRWYFVDLTKIADNDRTILQVTLTDTPTHEAALKLLLLWRPNLSSGQPVAASEPVIPEPLPEPAPPEPSPMPPVPGNRIPLSQITNVKGQKPPKAIKFSNDNPHDIGAWWQVFHEIAEWLVQRGTLTADKLPIMGIASINSSPFGPSGKPFEQPKEVSGGIYIRAKQSSEAIVKSSTLLLQHFRIDPSIVELQLD